jgi:hypothetical protein
MFFEPRPPSKTVILLDVEQGSVGGALLHLKPEHQPKLFGQTRKILPLAASLSTAGLMGAIEKAAAEVLEQVSIIAARIRSHEKFEAWGTPERLHVFFSAPWARLESDWKFEAQLREALNSASETFFEHIALTYHPLGRVLLPLGQTLIPEEKMLIVAVGGEITEVFLIHDGSIVGHATMPSGHNLLLRTLKTHGGLTTAELHSIVKLSPPHIKEPLEAAGVHFAEEFKDLARQLIGDDDICSVLVVAHEPHGVWYAKTLGGEVLRELFPHGGTVRALRGHHLTRYVETPPHHDLLLMAQAIFVDSLQTLPAQ